MNANEIITLIGKAVGIMTKEQADEFLGEIIEDCEIRKEALKYD